MTDSEIVCRRQSASGLCDLHAFLTGIAAVTKEIPILFCAVTDPVGRRTGKIARCSRGKRIGTTDRSPVAQQLDLVAKVLPNAKRLGTIYNAGERIPYRR